MKLKVKLAHAMNPDIARGYWEQPRFVEVESIDEASRKCTEYIDENGLGGGNWAGGQVYDGGVARISCNGRAWDADGGEIALQTRWRDDCNSALI